MLTKRVVYVLVIIFYCATTLPNNVNTYFGEKLFIQSLQQAIPISTEQLQMINEQIVLKETNPVLNKTMLPLFIAYPMLANHIPYIELGNFPTPVYKLQTLSTAYNVQLYIKDDGQSSGKTENNNPIFGGNKVRKLGFLFGQALQHNAESVVTFGGVGSNHATATTAYAHQLGLKPIIMLTPQPNSSVVQRNLLLMNHYASEIYYCTSAAHRAEKTIEVYNIHKKNYGEFPYFIRTGGSNSVGALGFVNAAFELKKQILEGVMPEPDYLYVACGSFGTVAGLLLGLQAAKINTHVVGITIEPTNTNRVILRIKELFKKTNELLHLHDATFPIYNFPENKFTLTDSFCGTKYGLFTVEGRESLHIFDTAENITLDGTYTAKTASALLHDMQSDLLKNKTVLFWNTFYSGSLPENISNDYTTLPKKIHTYFTEPTQD